jgi:hypothetical protein
LQVVQRQVGPPRLRMVDRVLLAGLARSLPRSSRSSLFVSPATLLRWHRQLVARRWTYARRSVGRPRRESGISEPVLRLWLRDPETGLRFPDPSLLSEAQQRALARATCAACEWQLHVGRALVAGDWEHMPAALTIASRATPQPR